MIGVCLAAILTWGFIGRIPTRAGGEGVLVRDAGNLVDAISAVAGRLDAVEVAAGDRVVKGQVIARIVQTDTEQRYQDAVEALKERERERDELAAAIKRELEIKSADAAAQKNGAGAHQRCGRSADIEGFDNSVDVSDQNAFPLSR